MAEFFGVHIGGRSEAAEGLETQLISPADGRPWATVRTSLDQLARALESSRKAQAEGAWARMDAPSRARVLWRLADLIEQRAEEIARLEVLGTGKTLRVTQNEAASVARWYRFFGGATDKLYGSFIQLTATAEAKIQHEPVGLVAAITPSNGPLSLGTWKIAPALAAGNVILVKPPLEAPGSTLLLAELAAEAGLPPGTLNVVPGGADIGEALAASEAVDMVTFTGSTAVAKKLGGLLQANLKRFVCEAGGKSAQIIFEDADLDAALIQARQGVFSNAGQSCVAGSRLLVHRSCYSSFVERLVERTALLRVGDPFDRQTHVGPLYSRRQLERVESFVQDARQAGAHVAVGGKRPELPEAIRDGWYYSPTVFIDVTNDLSIWREEIFGPVVAVAPFDEEEEAISLANGTRYGLAASVWTSSVARAQRVSRQLQAGTVWVNTYRVMNPRLPFGGYKDSGLGRENGLQALQEFLNVKTVITEEARPADAFAY